MAFAKTLVGEGKRPRRTSELTVAPETATPGIFEAAREQAKKKFKNRMTPDIAIRAVEASVRLPIDQGLLEEEKLANESKATPDAKALIHLFFAERKTAKIPDLPKDVKARPVKKVAIVGSGTMGGGIAMCFANAGIPVTIIDVSQDALGARPEGRRRQLSVPREARPHDPGSQGQVHELHLRRSFARGGGGCRSRHRGGVREDGAQAADLPRPRPHHQAGRDPRDEHLHPGHQ